MIDATITPDEFCAPGRQHLDPIGPLTWELPEPTPCRAPGFLAEVWPMPRIEHRFVKNTGTGLLVLMSRDPFGRTHFCMCPVCQPGPEIADSCEP